MSGIKIYELKEGKGVWSYPGSYTPGAFRLIDVKPLLSKSRSRIILYEFPSIDLQAAAQGDGDIALPDYAAISHVWSPSPAVVARGNPRPLHIALGESKSEEISWLGLMQAAIAAKHLKCKYLWLDYVCLNQTSKEDKKRQIQNMANIYAYCSSTIVMFGGVRCAQGLGDESRWHTRAWTLQEALESAKRGRNAVRYALFEWEYDQSFEVYRRDFHILDGGLAIVPIRELLDLQGAGMPISKIRKARKSVKEYEDPILVPVRSFGENEDIILSLLRPLYLSREWYGESQVHDGSIWRALWVRTSSWEHDILYSTMNLFSTPVRLSVNYEEKFVDVLEKFLNTLHKKPRIPYWLAIGHRIPVWEWSGLFPKRPNFTRHEVPTYTIGDQKTVETQDMLCGSGCCSNLDWCVEITGASKETGHTLCAKVLKLVRVAQTQTLPTYTEHCWQHVRKISVSYTPGELEVANGENWNFKIDAGASVEASSKYSRFDKKNTPLNRYDGSTGHPVVPEHNKNEMWIRSRTGGADLAPLERSSPDPLSVDLTALCWLDGSLGPYLGIMGFYNTHYQNPIVYFFDRTKDGVVQRVGTGKLLLAEIDRIRDDIPWKHIKIGGRMTDSALRKCDCDDKPVVPLIKIGRDDWSSEWLMEPEQATDETEWETEQDSD